MTGKKIEASLPIATFDDMFSTQTQREEEQLAKIREIPIAEIDDFPNHPFKVRDDDDMQNLVESVKARGIITPATVRQKEDGRYELISGHRRKRACEILGMENLRCEVVELTREEATILMVESNFQRSEILPSEKAFAYKLRLDAMNRQGQRADLTSAPLGQKLSREVLATESGESHSQIHRYIRLTNLIPKLLELVDEGKIKMRPAVELSYLDESSQNDLLTEIEINEATPSHDQARRMRKLNESNSLSPAVIKMIMQEEKPNQKERIILRRDKVASLLPNMPIEKTEAYIIKALEHYKAYLKNHSRSR